MSREYKLESKEDFIRKLEVLTGSGISPDDLTIHTPFHVHESDKILGIKESKLKYFTLFGALSGFILSLAFMIYTVLEWPIIVGGKPLIALPAFIIVAFECTILFGGIISFIGFLHLTRLPSMENIMNPVDCENKFIIIDNREGR